MRKSSNQKFIVGIKDTAYKPSNSKNENCLLKISTGFSKELNKNVTLGIIIKFCVLIGENVILKLRRNLNC